MSFFTAYTISPMSIKWFTNVIFQAHSNVLKVCKALEVLGVTKTKTLEN